MEQRPGRMHCASTGLRSMPNYDQEQRVKCLGSEMNTQMHKLKKVQGTKAPDTVGRSWSALEN